MKNLFFNNKVFLVEGSVKSCIYDLNKNKLYSINKKTKELIEKAINNYNAITSNIEFKLIDKLIESSILIFDKENGIITSDIESIAKEPNIEWAWIEITKKCNLQCIHCYENSSYFQKDIMSFKNFKKVIDNLMNENITNIQLIGGEPLLLKENLFKMLDYSISKINYIEIFTNGTLLSDNHITYFKKNNIHLALSLHSYIEEEHEKITTVKGSFTKTIATIKKLQKNDIPFRIATIEVKGIDIGKPQNNEIKINKPDLVRLSGRANLNMYSRDMLKKKIITKEKFRKPINIKYVSSSINTHNCFGYKIYIDTNLNVYPCVMERDFIHGNIKENTIREILNDDILQLSKNKIENCRDCEYRYACYDCRPDKLNKDKYSQPWYCSYNVNKGEWIDENLFINNLLNV